MEPILIFIIGILVSAFGTIVGFGGGIFMVPILIIVFDYPISFAVGATLASLVPAALISSIYNYRERNIDYLVATLIQVPAIAGTILGAFLMAFLPVLEMQFFFAFFVIALALYMLMGRKKLDPDQYKASVMYRMRGAPTSFIRRNQHQKIAYRLNGTLIAFFGFFSGTIAGLFGVGGSFMQTPFMIKVFRMPSEIATSTSLFILVLTSSTGLVSHYLLGNVIWEKSLPLMAAFAIGAALGRSLKKGKRKLPGTELLIGIGLLLAGTGVIVNILIKSGVL